MKKGFFLAGLAFTLFACNTNSNNSEAKHDSAGHAAHSEAPSNASNASQSNPVTGTMDRMMHRMHGAAPTGNNDIDFAAMMIEHHKGAVDMSEVEVSRGKDPDLKAFAKKVIEDQNKEIGLMEQLMSKAEKTASPNSAAFKQALNGSMTAMMNSNTKVYNDIDKDFAAQMIPHHQSAVDMAKAYLEYGQDKDLRTLCQNIISSQEKEIEWLRDWLEKNGK
ncbi:MAG TPA: DUF305 domain-containing protein [Flavisolibacter sp.]|nr:DUF305 domain-containing protein [Flavisolibacter sp.]